MVASISLRTELKSIPKRVTTTNRTDKLEIDIHCVSTVEIPTTKWLTSASQTEPYEYL